MKKKIIKVNEDTFELTEVEIDVPDEEVSKLEKPVEDVFAWSAEDKVKDKLEKTEKGPLIDEGEMILAALGCGIDELNEKFRRWKRTEKEFKDIYEPFKTKLLELYDGQNLPKNIVMGEAGCGVKLTYVSPSTRSTIDSKKLKEEEPEIAKKFTKITDVGATVRIEEL